MRRAVAFLYLLLSTTGRAAAHAGHDDGPGLLPPTLFLAGLAVLATSVYLDHRGMVDRSADIGVAFGVLGIVAGIATLFI